MTTVSMGLTTAIVSLLLFLVGSAAAAYRPVVLMHGLFGSSEAMSHIATWLQQDYPGIYIYNAEIGDGRWDSLLFSMNKQIDIFAAQVRTDPKLAGGFDLIGHSQGGLITRAYIERYNNPPVHTYISLAGPQAGIFGIPDLNDVCPDVECPWLAEIMSAISEGGWTEPLMQEFVSFAQYWKNPLNYSAYLNASTFLADVNNERSVKNATYKQNMASVHKAIFVEALQDHIVVPKRSAWFEFYAIGQDSVVLNLTQSRMYKEDWIGLRTLDQRGALVLTTANCTHQNMCREQCKTTIYEAIIKPAVGRNTTEPWR